MTDNTDDTTAIAERVDGWDQMDARQVTVHQWTVTSWRDEDTVVQQVNLLEPSCTCTTYQEADQDAYACDHILLCNHRARRQIDVGEALNYDLLERVKEVDQHVQAIEQRSLDIATAATTESDDSTDTTDDSSSGGDSSPLAGFDDLDDGPDALQSFIEDQFGSDPAILQQEVDDGYEIVPVLSDMDDQTLDEFDDFTGPEGSDFISPIWPDDYEDGDPPDGQMVTAEDLGKLASLL